MNKRLEQMRGLLAELEKELDACAERASDPGFSAMELPIVIQEIVDDLQPLLTPYAAVLYWYLFRHSIAKNGSPHLRVSTRDVQTGVVRSSHSSAAENTISLQKVRETFRALQDIGAVRKDGEPNLEGTLYRVLIPDEIEACRRFRAERAAREPAPEVTEAEIDYYNVRENRLKVYERDGYRCRYCEKQLTRFTATLDHVTPVSADGDNSLGNLVTACLTCNSQKTGRPVGDFLAER